jgi:O-antigen ligase
VTRPGARPNTGDDSAAAGDTTTPDPRAGHDALDRLALAGLVLYSAAAGLSIAASQIAYGVALLAWLLPILAGKRRFRRTPLDAFFLAYLAAELVSFAFSQDHAENLVFARRLLLIPMFYLVADRVRSARDVAWLLVPLIGVATLQALWGIGQYLTSAGGLEHRVRLLQYVLTTSGLFMMIELVALGLWIGGRSGAVRWMLGMSCVAITLCQFFTYSRSAWLGTAAGALVFLACWKPRAMLLLPVGVLALYLAAPGPIRERMSSAFDPSHPNNVERVHMWRAGIEMVRDHPWTGVGDISLRDLYPRYRSPQAREMVSHLHNNLLVLAVTLGIPGALAVVALFVMILRVLIQNVRSAGGGLRRGLAVGALAAYVGFHVMGLFEWNFGDAEVMMLLWYVLGLSEAAVRMSRA